MLFPALLAQVDSTELVLWHRASDSAPKGCGPLFSFLSLFYLLVSFCICLVGIPSLEVTVTSISLSPFVSRRGLSNTNQRLSA